MNLVIAAEFKGVSILLTGGRWHADSIIHHRLEIVRAGQKARRSIAGPVGRKEISFPSACEAGR